MYVRVNHGDKPVKLIPMPAPIKVDPFGSVDGNGEVDNGLGFAQGSVSGVVNEEYQCSGFQRQRLPAKMCYGTCPERNLFNLKRMCTSAYRCNYDPFPNCGIRRL
jgi:hypothetical protein